MFHHHQLILISAIILTSSSLSSSTTSSHRQDKDEWTRIDCSPIPEEKTFILECPEDMKLAIREAYFSTSLEHNQHCQASNYIFRTGFIESCYENLRLQVNSRCSGVKRCNFTDEDVLSQCHGPGHIFLTYSCVSPNILAHYCNTVLERNHGYVASPTYPDYSASIDKCTWTIRGKPGQWIDLEILDTHLSAPRVVKPKTYLDPAVMECTDSLTIVADEDQKLATLCGDDVKNYQTLISKGSQVKLVYKQNQFRATRGFLVRYQVKGCPRLKDPYKGHIIDQNETLALITCCEGYIFKDTRESKKQLTCLTNNWDGIVSSCIAATAEVIVPEVSEASVDVSFENPTNPPLEQNDTIQEVPKALFSDIFIPVSLMVLLVVFLVIIVVVLIKCRRREKSRLLSSYVHEASVPLTNQPPVNV